MLKEHLVEIRDAPKHVPKRRGNRISLSAIYRWINRGISGVRLETILVGRTRYTSIEALARFSRDVTAAKDERSQPASPPSDRRRDLKTLGLTEQERGPPHSDESRRPRPPSRPRSRISTCT